MAAARAGFGVGDFPFAFGDDDLLPPPILRQNPPYYHTLLKEAGFESERGWVDYRVEVTPMSSSAAGSHRRGRLNRVGSASSRTREVPTDVAHRSVAIRGTRPSASTGASFRRTREEFGDLVTFLEPMGMLETSRHRVSRTTSRSARCGWSPSPRRRSPSTNGRELRAEERVNFLAIGGPHERARRQGVNMAHGCLRVSRARRARRDPRRATRSSSTTTGPRAGRRRSSGRRSVRTTWCIGANFDRR